jgi:hypothetical protein
LSELYSNDPIRRVIAAENVSWMTSNLLPGQTPYLSRITGIPSINDEFMRSVFGLEPGQAGVALNAPHDTVYVVKVTGVDSSDEQLRQRFVQSGPTTDIDQLAGMESQRALGDWYTQFARSLGVQWLREPRPSSRQRNM